MRATLLLSVASLVTLGHVVGCGDGAPKNLAPTSSALTSAKPATATAAKMVIAPKSAVTFLMEAPLEKIHGKAPGGASGEVFVDPTDVTKTTGLVKVDLEKLELFQQKRESETAEYAQEEKSDLQNEHARAWLEIGADAPADQRAANQRIEFKITSVTATGPTDLTKLEGDTRKVVVEVSGDLRLHGRTSQKTVQMDATFRFKDGKLVAVDLKTAKPFLVDLDAHDVRPREAFGKLAQKTLEMMAPKVAKEANVSLDLTLEPAG